MNAVRRGVADLGLKGVAEIRAEKGRSDDQD